jgi:hypothetical protein
MAISQHPTAPLRAIISETSRYFAPTALSHARLYAMDCLMIQTSSASCSWSVQSLSTCQLVRKLGVIGSHSLSDESWPCTQINGILKAFGCVTVVGIFYLQSYCPSLSFSWNKVMQANAILQRHMVLFLQFENKFVRRIQFWKWEDSVAGRLSSEKLQQGPRRSYISTGAFPEWFSLYTATEIERVKTTGSTCDKVEFILAVLWCASVGKNCRASLGRTDKGQVVQACGALKAEA